MPPDLGQPIMVESFGTPADSGPAGRSSSSSSVGHLALGGRHQYHGENQGGVLIDRSLCIAAVPWLRMLGRDWLARAARDQRTRRGSRSTETCRHDH